jgi:hypothetical protein
MEPPADQIEHVDKLREDERLASRALPPHADELLNQYFDLGG